MNIKEIETLLDKVKDWRSCHSIVEWECLLQSCEWLLEENKKLEDELEELKTTFATDIWEMENEV